MSEATQTPTDNFILHCEVHPNVETSLRCNKCNRPMCTKCAVRTPVGYRCKECVRGQQDVYFTGKSTDMLIQGAVALPLAAIGSFLIGFLGFGFFGWLIAFWAGSAAGAGIADVGFRLVGKRRTRYGYVAVAGAIVVGGLLVMGMIGFRLTILIFVAMTVAGAVGRLRFTR